MRARRNQQLLAVAAALLVVALSALVAIRTEAGDPAASGTVSQAQIEQLLKKLITDQGGGTLIMQPGRSPSPVPSMDEVHFFVDAAGQRRAGVVYVTGQTMVVGQLIDVATEENLTSKVLPPARRITYDLANFDLKGRPTRGDDSAVLTLIEYSDFQCPYCKQLHGTLQTLMNKYPGKVRLFYKHFPLEIHPLAYRMALASECARAQRPEAFWLLHDAFFDDQYTGQDVEELKKRLRDWAGRNGLDGAKLTDCVEERKFAALVDADMEEGKGLGIRGTPVVIANGQFLSGAQPLPVFDRLLVQPRPPKPPMAPAP